MILDVFGVFCFARPGKTEHTKGEIRRLRKPYF